MRTSTAAAPRFAPNPHRRAMIAKVHLAKKELQLADDDYRAVLQRVTGQTSSADCTDAQLVKLLDELKAKGFRPKVAPRAADTPIARKARALWISLHHLGAIENPSEQALEAFARRQLGVAKLQWANQTQGYKLIEALKAIAERAGWSQSIEQVSAAIRLPVLKLCLVEAIVAKLKVRGLAAADWSIDQAAWSLLGERRTDYAPWDLGQLDMLARGFGAKLRRDVQ